MNKPSGLFLFLFSILILSAIVESAPRRKSTTSTTTTPAPAESKEEPASGESGEESVSQKQDEEQSQKQEVVVNTNSDGQSTPAPGNSSLDLNTMIQGLGKAMQTTQDMMMKGLEQVRQMMITFKNDPQVKKALESVKSVVKPSGEKASDPQQQQAAGGYKTIEVKTEKIVQAIPIPAPSSSSGSSVDQEQSQNQKQSQSVEIEWEEITTKKTVRRGTVYVTLNELKKRAKFFSVKSY